MPLFRPGSRHGLPRPSCRRQWLPIACLLAALFPVAFAAAETPSRPADRYWSFQFENDFFANAGDRYYTNGFQISHLRYTVGQQIFTPDDTQAVAVVPDDRPYAGYLYFSTNLLARVQQN